MLIKRGVIHEKVDNSPLVNRIRRAKLDKKNKVDQVDEQIIHILRHQGRITLQELGEKVHLTGQAVKNRIEKLEDKGIIQQYTVNVNCPVYGFPLHALIRLEAGIPQKIPLTVFLAQCGCPVLHCYQITGRQVYMLDMLFRSMEDQERILLELQKYGICTVDMVLQSLKLPET